MTYLNNQFENNNTARAAYFNVPTFRVFDLIFSLSALLLLAPLLMFIAIAVKLTSRGPIFFKQRRYGKNQKVFTIYKFRTMAYDIGANDFEQCVENDQRITNIGRILRMLSLDELTQLFNVLIGDMSIVGPRPHALAMDDEYLKTIQNYDIRFKAKPGITGLAQIRGYRGPTDTHEKIIGRLEADIEYIAQKSILKDIRIIFLTIPALLNSANSF